MTATIPERVEEIADAIDRTYEDERDRFDRGFRKQKTKNTLTTALTETDQQARESERDRIRKVIEAASLSCGGYNRSSDEAFAHGRALNTILQALSNPPSQV